MLADLLILIIIISLITLTAIQCLEQWKVIEWVEMHMFKVCYFCLGFWLSVLMTIIYGVVTNFTIGLMIVPFACTSLISILHKIWKS